MSTLLVVVLAWLLFNAGLVAILSAVCRDPMVQTRKQLKRLRVYNHEDWCAEDIWEQI